MAELPLEELLAIENDFERRMLLAALLQEALQARGQNAAVVGGHAVEVYTLGSYATGDIDMVVFDKAPARAILESWDFAAHGRLMWHEALGVAVDLIAERLGGDWRRTSELEFRGHTVRVIGPEDLVIDRLNACVHWNSPDHCQWAETILRALQGRYDLAYLRQKAAEEGVSEALERILGLLP